MLGGYMRAMRLGGETPVVVTVDPDVAQLWPEFFAVQGAVEAYKPVRSGRLSLLLMGKEQVFLRPIENKETAATRDTLVISRSAIKEVMFPAAPARRE
jgi:hypothetical protein